MEKRTSQKCRLVFMLIFTFGFFLVEIICGYITESLALISDSFHMLSDCIALGIGLACLSIANRQSKNNTYGWVRAEILGAMVNSVFLIALCFSIFTEAMQRMVQPEKIRNPDMLLYVGIAGLVVNVVGLLMFCSDASGVHHGHSHGDGGGHTHVHRSASISIVEVETYGDAQSECIHDALPSPAHSHHHDHSKKVASSAQMNIHGVFLHILGDALGSVVVIVSALVIKFVDGDWKYRLDPAMSLAMVIIILSSTIPLFKQTAYILIQNVPNHIKVDKLAQKLTNQVDGILGIHELHIWQLAGSRIIASLHIRCQNLADYVRISKKLKDFFHNEGIHSTTIQPEFVELEEIPPIRECALECGPDKECFPSTCCSTKTLSSSSSESSPSMHASRNRNSNNSIQPDYDVSVVDETTVQQTVNEINRVTHM